MFPGLFLGYIMKRRLVDIFQHRIDLDQSCSYAPWEIGLELLGFSYEHFTMDMLLVLDID